MKTFFEILWKIVSTPIMFILAYLFNLWPIWLICLCYGAYQTAAKEWGWGAGLLSIVMAFVLPVATFCLWCCAFGTDAKDVKTKVNSSKSKSARPTGNAGRSDEGLNQVTYLRLLASMMAKMAKADGHVDVTEIRAAEKAFSRLGFTPSQREACIAAFRDALRDPCSADQYALRMTKLGFSYEMRMVAYEVLWEIACADGILSKEEKALLEELVRQLALAPGTFERYYRKRVRQKNTGNSNGYERDEPPPRRDPLADAYDELGCNCGASDDELRKAYRDLAKKLHPDILRAQGLPESLMGRANERMARINSAWDKVKKARNIKS